MAPEVPLSEAPALKQLPLAHVAALLCVDRMVTATKAAAGRKGDPIAELAGAMRHVPRKNGLSASITRITSELEATGRVFQPEYTSSIERSRAMESTTRALAEASLLTMLWQTLALNGATADHFEDVGYFAKVLTERLEPRERLASLILYCRGLRTPSTQDKNVARLGNGLLTKFLQDFPGNAPAVARAS